MATKALFCSAGVSASSVFDRLADCTTATMVPSADRFSLMAMSVCSQHCANGRANSVLTARWRNDTVGTDRCVCVLSVHARTHSQRAVHQRASCKPATGRCRRTHACRHLSQSVDIERRLQIGENDQPQEWSLLDVQLSSPAIRSAKQASRGKQCTQAGGRKRSWVGKRTVAAAWAANRIRRATANIDREKLYIAAQR